MPHERPGHPARLEALRLELRADLTPNPDERRAIPTRGHDWACGLKPHNFFTAWLVDQAAVHGLRIDRLQRIERRRRLRRSIRAAFFWDDDRRIDVERLGTNLAAEPAAVKRALEQTPQGCDWILLRWSHLALLAREPAGWGDPERQLALNLLGTPADLRPVDLAVTFADPLPIVAREVARLEAIKLGVVGDLDAFDRANVEADLIEDRSPEANQVRRDLATHHNRLRWCYQQIKSPIQSHSASAEFLEMCFPLPQELAPPAPVVESPRPEPVVEVVAQPEPEVEPEVEVEIPLAPPVPKTTPSRRQRRAKIAQARQSGRRSDRCQT